MFHPLPPAPCFLYAWPASHAIDAIYQALAQAAPDMVPACSGGDVLGVVSWGIDPETGEPWGDGPPHPSGQGAHATGDGASALQHFAFGNARSPPAEVYETKTRWMIIRRNWPRTRAGRAGIAADSGSRTLPVPRRHYVCDGCDREDRRSTRGSVRWCRRRAEPRNAPAARRSSAARLQGHPQLPEGGVFVLRTGGGGGYGPPEERDAQAVLDDLADGYISEEHARVHYPHVKRDAAR